MLGRGLSTTLKVLGRTKGGYIKRGTHAYKYTPPKFRIPKIDGSTIEKGKAYTTLVGGAAVLASADKTDHIDPSWLTYSDMLAAGGVLAPPQLKPGFKVASKALTSYYIAKPIYEGDYELAAYRYGASKLFGHQFFAPIGRKIAADLASRYARVNIASKLEGLRDEDRGISLKEYNLESIQDKNTEQYFIWRTMNDGRVRDNHAVLDGKVFLKSTGAGGLFPGDDYNCRCWTEEIR